MQKERDRAEGKSDLQLYMVMVVVASVSNTGNTETGFPVFKTL
jgi:hypothetical protein